MVAKHKPALVARTVFPTLSEGNYELARALLRIFPPTYTIESDLVAVVKAKGLEEAKSQVLDVFGIEY
ncbi:hypothetical protein H9P43_003957 [Blastocladiella emersonii ATCC 22665]|nr:hypothetical protein H9P43_003957 [Blastocladiella emersonii ATCC 22665]